MSYNREDEIIKKANDILNSSNEKSSQDKALQIFVKFIFTNGFKEDKITLPAQKRNKEGFNYLEKYIQLVHSLFKLTNEERLALYNTEPGSNINYEISQLIKSLKRLMDNKQEEFSNLKTDEKNLVNKIKLYFFNLIHNQPYTLFNLLDQYHFYFIFYFPKLSVLKLLLYTILKNKFQNILSKFDYIDFCPDFNNQICQNLIILFFENIKKEKRELLFIFSLLIFKFEIIFKEIINQKISKYVLQYAAKKTYEYVKSKTLNNKLIFEYTYNQYLFNLDNTINSLIETKKKISDLSNNNKYESNINNSQLSPLNINNNKQLFPKTNENTPFSIENNDLKKKDDKDPNTHLPKDAPNVDQNNAEEKTSLNTKNLAIKEIIDLKNKENKDENTEINTFSSSFINNSLNEKNNNHKELSDKKKIEQKIEDNKNEIKEVNNEITPDITSQINNSISVSTNLGQNIINLSRDQIDKMSSRNLYSLFIDTLSEHEKKFSEQEKKFSEQEKKFSEHEKKFSEMSLEINNLKDIIGTIQIRTFAKNFLKIFRNDLSEKEKDEIRKCKSKRGEITLDAFRKKYSQYKNKENFKIIAEIIEKSGKALNRGNSFAHTIKLEDYENEITEFKTKFNITMIDHETMEKLLFLIKIGISTNSFSNCFNFVMRFCEKEMTLGFMRNNNNIESFIKSN